MRSVLKGEAWHQSRPARTQVFAKPCLVVVGTADPRLVVLNRQVVALPFTGFPSLTCAPSAPLPHLHALCPPASPAHRSPTSSRTRTTSPPAPKWAHDRACVYRHCVAHATHRAQLVVVDDVHLTADEAAAHNLVRPSRPARRPCAQDAARPFAVRWWWDSPRATDGRERWCRTRASLCLTVGAATTEGGA